MRTFVTLWKRELLAYFLSPIAYVTMMFFLIVMGFSFWFLVSVLTEGTSGISLMRVLFGESIFFWIALLIIVPVITMRLIAEEKRSGTLETLMTAPVTDVSVVLAKYFGALCFFIIMWMPTVAYAYVLKAFSPLSAPVDLGPMLSSYVGAFLVGAFYISIGVLTSALTRNQILAAVVCFAVICVAFFSGFVPYFATNSLMQNTFRYTSSLGHMLDFSRGVVDSRPVVFYLSSIAFVLYATVKALEFRRWR
ncbi:MAG: ABC transporter permease [Verrucomicrobia bacterium]|nr:ABC transporter permease [Verrucomicrobiota bacterium]